MIRKQVWRAVSLVAAASLAMAAMAGPVSAGGRNTSKAILIGSTDSSASGVNDPGPNGTGQALLTFTPVTAGGATYFDVEVLNDGGQNINDVQLSVGYDDNSTVESTRPVTVDLTPTFPVAFPDATGATVTYFDHQDVCQLAAASVGPINCVVGTLRKGQSFTLQVVLSTTTPGTIPVKAVTKVAENTNDNGGNQDTFAAEGALTVTDGGCDLVSTYLLPDNAKPIQTCQAITLGNPQSTSVKFDNGKLATAISVGEASEPCPTVIGATCIGDASIADIMATFSGAVTWTIKVDVTGLNINLNKLTVYHFSDTGSLLLTLPNKKQSQCKTATSTDCLGADPTITTVDGRDILTVVVVTKGNGKIRFA